MITSKDKMDVVVRQNMRDGGGFVTLFNPLPDRELPAHVRVLSVMEIKKGSGIGKHDHMVETEIYYILKGEGVYDDNGEERAVHVGDMTISHGGYHALRNEKEEPLEVLAVIVTEK